MQTLLANRGVLVSFMFVVFSTVSFGATKSVSTVAEINDALTNYSDGDVIVVAPNEYNFTGITNDPRSGTQDSQTRRWDAHFKTLSKKGFTLRGDVSGHWGAGQSVVFKGDCRFLNQLSNGGRCHVRNIVFDGFNGGTWRSGGDENNRGGAINSKAINDGNGWVTVSNCVFRGNKAYYGGALNGGEAIDCLFVGNESLYDGKGGAVCSAKLVDSVFSNNVSVTSHGVAYTYKGVFGCVFVNNKAKGGDGGVLSGNGTDRPVTNCVFIGNVASGNGGAISGDNVYVFDSVFCDNRAAGGGAISLPDKTGTAAVISDCAFSNNAVTASSVNGGALLLRAASSTVSDCMFYGNAATNSSCSGGAIYTTKAILVTNCAFVANQASVNGGACAVSHVQSRMAGCSFVDNRTRSYGGGVHGIGTLVACAFTNNYSAKCAGAYYGDRGGIATNCTFAFNRSEENGAGVYAATVYGSDLADNHLNKSQQDNYGGGDGVDSKLFDCTLSGGRLQNCVLNRCRIVGVTNAHNRCVFYAENWATNCLIAGCDLGCTEVFYRYTQQNMRQGECVNCTFADNTVNYLMYNTYGITNAYRFVNCIFNGNKMKNGTACDLSSHSEKGAGGKLTYPVGLRCCLYGVLGASFPLEDQGGNKVGDARFARERYVAKLPNAEYYMIRHSSPAHGSGDLLRWTVTDTDLVGAPRLRDGTVDMGCYESDLSLGLVLVVR